MAFFAAVTPRSGTRSGLQTFTLDNGSAQAEVCPDRGALVTRFSTGGDEVLYLDEATFADPAKNVRGGVPILFPVAGPAEPGSPLKQHGFARLLPWAAAIDGETVRLTLEASDATRPVWPFEFRIDFGVELVGTRLELRWMVHNLDTRPMPLHFGLHPYFRVPPASKARASVETTATKAWNNRSKSVGPVPKLDFGGEELDVHLLDHAAKHIVLQRGDGTDVPLSWSAGFDTVILWTTPGSGFICVEPWNSPVLPALAGPRPHLQPGGSASFAFVVGR